MKEMVYDKNKCEVCSENSAFKCSACKNVYYCCVEHQRCDWKTHKLKCFNNIDKNNHENMSNETEKSSQSNKLSMKFHPNISWLNGFSVGNSKYEWIVDAYRLRVEDDNVINGWYHGLYNPSHTKLLIVKDFLIFCKVGMVRKVIPEIDWDWGILLQIASSLLQYKFEKIDANKKYNGEGYLNGAMGLRYTGELITNIPLMGEEDHTSDTLYNSIYNQVYNVTDLLSLGTLYFIDIGNIDIWQKFLIELVLI